MSKQSFGDSLKEMNNFTETENGAVALKSTLNACLDAFGLLGSCREAREELILTIFAKAFKEDPAIAMHILFYIRDIRGGQGCRRPFRVILEWLANYNPEYVTNNLSQIMEYGRADDMLCLLNTSVKPAVLQFISNKLSIDIMLKQSGMEISLLAKWLPSENASSKETKEYARIIREGLGFTPRHYRKLLSELRSYIDVVERRMSANEWDTINYNTVPAKASMIYSDAFYKHSPERYIDYINNLVSGDSKVNARTLFPVDIIHKVRERFYDPYSYPNTTKEGGVKDRILLNAMWEALPNYFEGRDETGICVVDTSGSMWGLPIEVALSLGIYCADKCKGPFHNKFITFASRPELVELVGDDIVDKATGITELCDNTNIEAVFDLILKTAIANNTPQEDLPSKLYIISDMQFDDARRPAWSWQRREDKPKPFMQQMKERYAEAGYTMPSIVYWNVRTSECGMFQETFEGEDCCMVSGYSPQLFEAIIKGTTYEEEVTADGTVVTKQRLNPMTVMYKTVLDERYDSVYPTVDKSKYLN